MGELHELPRDPRRPVEEVNKAFVEEQLNQVVVDSVAWRNGRILHDQEHALRCRGTS